MNPAAAPVPALGAAPLMPIAAAATVALLVLIMRFQMHAFLALILVSLLTALAAGDAAVPLSPCERGLG